MIVGTFLAMRRSLIAIALTAVALSACGGESVKNTPATASPTQKANTVASATPDVPASPTASAASEWTKPFGSTFTWEGGVAVTVSAPQPYPATANVTMIDANSESFVVMDVTMKNGTAQPLDPILLQFRASTGKREAAQVFDYGNNVELPTVKVLPGNELTWRAAFGVDEGEPFVLTVDYAFGNETGIYQ